MSDPRFASLKTDPRFRRPRKHRSKVVLDDRFKHLLGDDKKKKKSTKQTIARVDKYGRTVSSTQEKEDLRRFYRLEEDGAATSTIIDYARGAVLMESSDEEEDRDLSPHVVSDDGSDSDQGGFVSLGPDLKNNSLDEDDVEVDLDEGTIAEYARVVLEQEGAPDIKQTRRLAVVNLDWDYVRAAQLYKICSSLVSPTAPLASTTTAKTRRSTSQGGVNVARGRILGVRVYPSEFGKKRMAKEEEEGPPVELFKNKIEDKEIDERTIFETGSEADYDEPALRKYQLERLRYYYAIVECDTVEAAVHVYNELEGTELERSANVFDLSFVPDDMTFDDVARDEATQPSDAPHRAVGFVTDALRHSKVKLTWDEDDPERNLVLRRPLTKKEIDEADFRAYIASSSSSEGDSEDEGGGGPEPKNVDGPRAKDASRTSKRAKRDNLRKLLLGGSDDELPEGWGNAFDNKIGRRDGDETRGAQDSDVDMEVTFTPGLSEFKNPEDENTLERYQRKMKEKRKENKEQARKRGDGDISKKATAKSSLDDEFFGVESDSQHEEAEVSVNRSRKKPTKPKKATEASKAELSLLAVSDNPHGEPAHFDMKAVLKAEKQAKNKKSKRKSGKHDQENGVDEPGETQDNFVIDVKDDRFAAIHEDHQFAIDPTNPQFKKTKSMAALLNERSRRQGGDSRADQSVRPQGPVHPSGRSLQSLVESVKRKSATVDDGGLGKRRKLGSRE